MGKYQIVSWRPDWQGFHFVRFNPQKTDLAMIYKWSFTIGYWEVRRWAKQFKET